MGSSVRKTGGPRTKRGKAVAKINGLVHGVTALSVPAAEQSAFRKHRQSFHEACQPANAMEEFLVDRIAMTAWRMKRLDAWEAFQLEMVRREAIARTTFNETPEPSTFDFWKSMGPKWRFANIRPEVMTMDQARVEIERMTNEPAWRYLKDDEAISELEEKGRSRLTYHEALKSLSDPPTLDEIREQCNGDRLVDPLFRAAFALHEALMEWGVEPEAIARAVLGHEPTEEESVAMIDAIEWSWDAAHLIALWRMVDDKAEVVDEGKPACQIVRSIVCREVVAGMRLQGIAHRVRLLIAYAEQAAVVPLQDDHAKFQRYDTGLERSLFKAMHELEALQEKRQGGSAPLARVEVNGNAGEK